MIRLLSLALISLILICSNEGAAVDKFVTGKVTHNGAKEIAKNSKVQVELRDTSLMDVASKLIGTTTITDATAFPVSYKVKYNPVVIVSGHTYSMSARITGPDGSLTFINDMHTPAAVAGSSAPVVDIAVIRVGGASSTSKGPTKPNGPKTCSPVNCQGKEKTCPYGYQKKDGCEICRCNDPCNPPGKAILCGSKKRCFVEKKPDGTFGTRCGTTPSHSNKNGGKLTKAACQEPKVAGLCYAAFPRFYYDVGAKKCEAFTYGGCGGNSNNFLTKSACEKLCKA